MMTTKHGIAYAPSTEDPGRTVWRRVLSAPCPDGHAEAGAPCWRVPVAMCGPRVDSVSSRRRELRP